MPKGKLFAAATVLSLLIFTVGVTALGYSLKAKAKHVQSLGGPTIAKQREEAIKKAKAEGKSTYSFEAGSLPLPVAQ